MTNSMLASLEHKIGYVFTDKALLESAVTHSSRGLEFNYERLEFLGDRVLGLIVSEILFEKFPNEPEGHLAKRLASLVQGSWLAEMALKIDLGAHVLLSEAETIAGGTQNAHILADVMESLIGAIYLDSKGERDCLAPCRAFIEKLWDDAFETMKTPPQHPKTALQEWLQGKALPLPEYAIVNQLGPDHAPVFQVQLSVKGYAPVTAEGRSRQDAEKAAAEVFLTMNT